METCKEIQKKYIENFWIISKVYNNSGPIQVYGLEWFFKFFLIVSRFFFPALHLGIILGTIRKNYFNGRLCNYLPFKNKDLEAKFWIYNIKPKENVEYQRSKNMIIEYYVYFKLICSISILNFQLFHHPSFGFLKCFLLYMTIETLLYPAALIFCRELFPRPASQNRDMIFIIIDYLMVVIDFASFYLIFNALNSKCKTITTSLDALYFSIVTSFTIGYGDITVSNDIGKKLVILQAIIFLIYGTVILSFYSSQISSTTYNSSEN